MTMTATRTVTRKPPPAPRFELMAVTPALAEEWLGRNSHNRGLQNGWVEALAGVISRGEWRLNGDAIRFDVEGTLLDGQHRLWAVVESGIAVNSMVGFDLQTEAQETMDQGVRRKLSDVLKLKREANASGLAAALNVKWRWDNGYARMTTRKPSIAQALVVLERNPGLRDSVAASGKVARKFKISAAILAVCWYEFNSLDTSDAEDFFSRLASGIGLESGSPVLALRRWLERQMAATTTQSAIMTQALVVKAWNYYRDGRQIETLVWRATGVHSEPFPTPK